VGRDVPGLGHDGIPTWITCFISTVWKMTTVGNNFQAPKVQIPEYLGRLEASGSAVAITPTGEIISLLERPRLSEVD
jgi:hypothetical protein